MHEREPSRTALAAAAHRAAHQVLEQGRIFADPLALRILGQPADVIAQAAKAQPARGGMRFFIASRSSIAEAALAEAVESRDVRQLVVLGAGLDTFAYRNPFGHKLRVFEVDHPATQAWKRRRLREAEIAIPPSLTFAPVDFERDDLFASLASQGFDPARRTFFTWLGVVPYLTKEAVWATLGAIGGAAGGAEVAFDYSDPPASLSAEVRAAQQRRAAAVAALGEPFLSYFEPAELHLKLAAFGFGEIEDFGPHALFERYLALHPPAEPNAGDWRSRPDRGGHVIVAATPFSG
jgi:methyltransferase (TIGR00027 family)